MNDPPGRSGGGARAPQGFTLLEVLIAFAIAGFALALLYGGGMAGLTASDGALRYVEAISRAQSRIASAAAGTLVAMDEQGDDAEYHWHLRATPLAMAPPDRAGRPVPALYALEVSIGWRQGGATRSLSLRTERIGAAPPPPR